MASMDSLTLHTQLDSVIASRKKAEELGKKKKKRTQGAGNNNQSNPFFLEDQNTTADWYFGNLSAVGAGESEFKRIWGSISLEDNWRRSNKTSIIKPTEQQVAVAEDPEDATPSQNGSAATDEVGKIFLQLPLTGVRLLMYHRKDQQYTILSPSLEKISDTKIDNSSAIAPWLVCSAGDLHLLILDAADWSIKKVDKRNAHVEQEFKIDPLLTTNPSFVFIREYQNLIFLYDEITGLSIFNNIGIKLKTYQIGTSHFNFLGQELYYLKDKKINFIDLFSGDTRQVDLPGQCDNILITDERLIKITANRLDFFEFQSQ
jgi:hypothetical protein